MGSLGDGSLSGSVTDSAGSAQSTGGRHKSRLAFPSQPCLVPWHGKRCRGGEERKDSGHSSALPMAQSWAPCHVHTPTCPSGLGKCFASGVTVVPEQRELFCQHSAFTSQVLGQGGRRWGTHVAPVKDPGDRGKRVGLEICGSACRVTHTGEEVGGVGWGGGCLRQEGQMGRGRVEVKGGGRGPSLKCSRA